MAFIEELMNLPKAWDLHQKILAGNDAEITKISKAVQGAEGHTYSSGVLRANVSKRDRTFEQYMSCLLYTSDAADE